MRIWLRRLIILLIVAIVATIIWDNRGRIGVLTNNGLRIRGDWYRVEMNFKGSDVYNFSERLLTRNGDLWGSYELRLNTKLEVTSSGMPVDYILEFEDDDNMVWFLESDGKRVPAVRWRR